MPSSAKTVEEYLKELPEDRRTAIEAVRSVIRENLGDGYEEGMQYGMIGYHVPHRLFPAGYHCDPKQPLSFVGLGSQKNHMGLYLMCIYMNADLSQWFTEEWKKTGKKLDMGKACVRFKRLDDLPLEVIGKLIARVPVKKYIAAYEAALGKSKTKPAKKAAVKKPAKKAN